MPELFFKGKEYVYNHHLTVPYRPLVGHADKSIGPADLGGNLIIHGDNLHGAGSEPRERIFPRKLTRCCPAPCRRA